MPNTSSPSASAARTTPRIAAFIPGASPPLVNTAIFLIIFTYFEFLKTIGAKITPYIISALAKFEKFT